ncbi:hypothetical protein HHK36_027915 [Tetracentron sinense]|uniref:peptidylprolyl isomerase n=1 Tax=Tetracentron sinense TaxID=13715 RepID=A0A834YFN1_TETSI|nr:hypothetical protein HHK36_027915 [Tetracentron sinense]
MTNLGFLNLYIPFFFSGVEVKPGNQYVHRLDKLRGRLHISQATLGNGSSTQRNVVQCKVGDKSPIFLCILLPNKNESCPLDLEFEEDNEVVFSVIGPYSVHLVGYYLGNRRDSSRHDEDSDSYGEDIAGTETEESNDDDTEDEYEDDFIDDGDLEVFPPSPVPNSAVVIEEVLDDEKPANRNGNRKRLKKKYQLRESDDDDSSQRQIFVKGRTAVQVLTSEDEDGVPISSLCKSNRTEKNTRVDTKEKTDKKTAKGKKKAKDDDNHVTGLKRKVDAVVQDGEPRRGTDQPLNLPLPSTEVGPENGAKPKKKKKELAERKAFEAGNDKKSNVLKEDKAQHEEAKTDNMDQGSPFRYEQDQKLNNDKSFDFDANHVDENCSTEKKKKKKKKNKTQEPEENANVEESVLEMEGNNGSIMEIEDNKSAAKPSQTRTFSNELVVEELAMGKPDGKRASPGQKVSVHYIGKLKKNGQIFDSNIGRTPFKFRLGVGEVIKGWDVGVNGMRVGDKRRLTVPPSMGYEIAPSSFLRYGTQGAGGKIPPNSWLVFDVELVGVR